MVSDKNVENLHRPGDSTSSDRHHRKSVADGLAKIAQTDRVHPDEKAGIAEEAIEIFATDQELLRDFEGGKRPGGKAITEFVTNICKLVYEGAGAAHYEQGVNIAVNQVVSDRARITQKVNQGLLEEEEALEEEWASKLGTAEEDWTSTVKSPHDERNRMIRLCELAQTIDSLEVDIGEVKETLKTIAQDDLASIFERVDEGDPFLPVDPVTADEEELADLQEDFETIKEAAMYHAQRVLGFKDKQWSPSEISEEDKENATEWIVITKPYFEEGYQTANMPTEDPRDDYMEGDRKTPRLIDLGPQYH